MNPSIRFVVATRESTNDFFTKTATGRSLAFYNPPGVELILYPENKSGLSKVYNQAIEESQNNSCIMVFSHDDIHFIDFYWQSKIFEALKYFEIIGLAGNKKIEKKQPSWLFIDEKFTISSKDNLSGVVGHGTQFPPKNLSVYGPPCQQVKLLDGLFLFCKNQTLLKNDIRFDERFDFHFYDLDLCRTANLKDISLGTWDISVIHESQGNLSSPSWNENRIKYFEKWGN